MDVIPFFFLFLPIKIHFISELVYNLIFIGFKLTIFQIRIRRTFINNNSFNIIKNTECQEFNFDGNFYRSYHTIDANGNVNKNALAILNSKTDEIVYVNNQDKNQIKEINHKIITNDFFNFLKDNKLISDNLDYNEF